MREYTVQEIANICGCTRQAVQKRAKKEGWPFGKRKGRGGGKVYRLADLPKDIQAAIQAHEAKEVLQVSPTPTPISTSAIEGIDEKRRRKATAKADLVALYTSYIYKAPRKQKTKARENFILAYKGGAWPEIYKVLGPRVSWKSIERWKVEIERTRDYLRLADKRGLYKKGATKLTEEQTKIILRCALNPNGPKVSQIYRMARAVLEARGIEADFSEATVRRFLEKFKSMNYHVWVWMREGSKAWNDKCAYYIERDFSLLQVGDILVADGHKLNFETINPFTGKPCRMTLVLWFDMASSFPLGWEIWPTENIATIASSLRRAIIRLGKLPRLVYLDNGKAFRAKIFNNVQDLSQAGFAGIFKKLGIQAIYAWPYHGQSKTVERFFGTFQEAEAWIPSYVGTAIDSKPPRLNRGEKLHRKIYEKAGFRPLTLEETHKVIAAWFDVYVKRPQRGHLEGKTPLEVFEQGRGPGVDPAQLRELMMAEEVKKINRNGISLLGQKYYHPMLYGRRHKVYIRYDLQDRSSILVYDENWNFLCEAPKTEKVHPAAYYLGDESDQEKLTSLIEFKRQQEKLASSVAREFLESEVLPEHRKIMSDMGMDASNSRPALPAPKPQKPQALSEAEKAELSKFTQKLLEKKAQKPAYERPEFYDEFERYEFLFQLVYRDGIELLPEDADWMSRFEQSETYQRIKKRYEQLKRVYATLKQKQEVI